MRKYRVLGLTLEEAREIEKELGVSFDFDMGLVGLESDDELNYEEIEEHLLSHIEKKYDVEIPRTDMRSFCSDGDQSFCDLGFLWGVIFPA